LIGIVFIVPLIIFAVRKQISRATGLKFAMIFALGAVQGFIGWFMVQSGLSIRTSVSPYRLALHLVFALAIYALLFWAALDGTPPVIRQKTPRNILRHGWIALIFFAVTLTWGAFVAGLHAGEVYNTWPLMEGDILPDAATTLQPVWINIFENSAFAQFIHRWLAPTTMIIVLAWVARCWRIAVPERRTGLVALAAMACIQVGLGIATLLSHAQIVIAVIHQAGAITLGSLILFNLQRLSCFHESEMNRPDK
jgi:cytochrome c oxidase assembly protein subunit 15